MTINKTPSPRTHTENAQRQQRQHTYTNGCISVSSPAAGKPGSLCTIAINPLNSLSRQFAENQHSLCKLAQRNMSAGILDVRSLLVFSFCTAAAVAAVSHSGDFFFFFFFGW